MKKNNLSKLLYKFYYINENISKKNMNKNKI